MVKEWQRTVESCSIIYMMATPEVPVPIMIDAVNFVDLLELTTKHDGIFRPIPLTKELIEKMYFLEESDNMYFLNNPAFLKKAKIEHTNHKNYQLHIFEDESRDSQICHTFSISWFHDLQHYIRKHLCSSDANWFSVKRVFSSLGHYDVTL